MQKIKEARPPKSKEVADEGSQTLPQTAARSTPDTRKRVRKPNASPEVSAAKKRAEKRPKASNKEEKWVEVPKKKDLRKRKGKKPSKTPEKHRRARPEAVLIKRAEGVNHASILRELKKRVNPDELGATVQGIRETRSKDLLVELKCSTKQSVNPRITSYVLFSRVSIPESNILRASGAETRFYVTAESNGMLCIPFQRNIM